jgi:hypothetical protein
MVISAVNILISDSAMKRIIFLLLIPVALGTAEVRGQAMQLIGVDPEGVPVFQMEEVHIWTRRSGRRDQRRTDNQMKKFNKLRYNVLKTLPYANEAARNLKVINAELARIPTEEGKEAYLDSRENMLFGRYEKEVKNLSISQGKVLVKLIDRQTGSTTYSLIRDYRSKTSAFFWNGIGRVFGYNLKEEYDPEEEFAIEVIVKSIENGQNPTYYDYLDALNAAGR